MLAIFFLTTRRNSQPTYTIHSSQPKLCEPSYCDYIPPVCAYKPVLLYHQHDYQHKVNINLNFILLVIFGDFRITGVQNSTDTHPPTLLPLFKKCFESDELYKHPSIFTQKTAVHKVLMYCTTVNILQ